ADKVVLTSDNPRSEDPEAILDEVEVGLRDLPEGVRMVEAWRDVDRATAIERAVREAQAGEVVLVAGKGHETYQEVAGVRRPFDDVLESARALAARAGGPRFHTDRLVAVAQGDRVQGAARPFDGVSIDTRTLKPGDAFFALRGPNFDGHRFLEKALAGGAAVLVVEAGHPALAELRVGDATVVAVADVQGALQALAAAHRAAFYGTVVALTGSSGKTTTKELLAAVLEAAGPTHKTPGNLNNHLGLPLTLLGLRPEHRFAVVELGMNHAGEIAALAALARPTVGVITSVGEAHIEHLGSVAAIARAKGELLDALPADGLAITPSGIRHEGELVAGLRAPRWTVGPAAGDRVGIRAPRSTAAGVACDLVVDGRVHPLTLQLAGAHNLSNAALAVAAGLALGVTPQRAVQALASVAPPRLRGEIRALPDGGSVVLDCYNANPQSMRAAAETFTAAHPQGWLVLGDMLELGTGGPALHADVGRWLAAQAPLARILAVGALAAELAAGARTAGAAHVWAVADVDTAVRTLRTERAPGAPVLLKASRGMALERVWALLSQEGA
ncbi:MAG: UDP-N-acetylmuramoyl-tripeptide--D-alanyl-D-alanine ligase, partial [Myxococcales bacterium]|nr:UDP-N-acetylmuramoyl-tripeptide--D-alanyl-D-alanine ligase [Myxococcales bacterium]